jgi:hypothetical protein
MALPVSVTERRRRIVATFRSRLSDDFQIASSGRLLCLRARASAQGISIWPRRGGRGSKFVSARSRRVAEQINFQIDGAILFALAQTLNALACANNAGAGTAWSLMVKLAEGDAHA